MSELEAPEVTGLLAVHQSSTRSCSVLHQSRAVGFTNGAVTLKVSGRDPTPPLNLMFGIPTNPFQVPDFIINELRKKDDKRITGKELLKKEALRQIFVGPEDDGTKYECKPSKDGMVCGLYDLAETPNEEKVFDQLGSIDEQRDENAGKLVGAIGAVVPHAAPPLGAFYAGSARIAYIGAAFGAFGWDEAEPDADEFTTGQQGDLLTGITTNDENVGCSYVDKVTRPGYCEEMEKNIEKDC